MPNHRRDTYRNGKAFSCFLLVLAVMFSGCSNRTRPENRYPETPPSYFRDQVNEQSDELARIQEQLAADLEKKAEKKISIAPVMPVYDPLEDQVVSFSIVDEELQKVLYTFAQAVGMNLILDPELTKEEKRVTLNLQEVPAAVVLQEMLKLYDVSYEIDDNIIRIKPFEERLFKLNFLNAEVNTAFDVGGDVLGAGDTEMTSGLSGSFKLTAKSVQPGNPYDVIEANIKQIKSKGGLYAINRMSGTLYVKDTPASIKRIEHMVEHFKTMQSKQIHIEARIIEVALSDEYRYGIDWSVVRDKAANFSTLTNVGWTVENGLMISHQNADWSINPMGEAVQALETFGEANVISNPSIRTKHGKPAIISVGTSINYKKSVKTTTSSGTVNPITESTVEVSKVFDGLILGVVPFIEENGKISLLINPIKSDVDSNSLELQSVGANSDQSISLPRVRIREISTTIALQNNDVIILGGLIDKYQLANKDRVPWLGRIPGLEYFFRGDYQSEEVRELVIILSVSIS